MIYLKLNDAMHQRRLNANKVAEMTGIRYPTVRDMELNKSKAWSPENLNKIMQALEIEDINELIGYEKEQED